MKSRSWKQRKRGKQSRKFESTLTQAKKTIKRKIEKDKNRSKFNDAWFVAIVKVNSETFHNNFKVGFQAHPLKYMGFDLGNTYVQQKNVRKQRKAKMQLVSACSNQVATFHSTKINERGKGLQWVLMALVMAN